MRYKQEVKTSVLALDFCANGLVGSFAKRVRIEVKTCYVVHNKLHDLGNGIRIEGKV
jgi:hypothetical protein